MCAIRARWRSIRTGECAWAWGRHSQALGNAIFHYVGIPPQEPAIVRARVNGVDLAESGNRMYGRYVRFEGRGGEWAQRHFPNDPDGNFYRLDDHNPGSAGTPPGNLGDGEFRYEAPCARRGALCLDI